MSSEGLPVALYRKLLRLRTDYHRLTPDRRLSSLKQAKVFIEEVGMATLTPGKELPSLFGAVQGRPYKPWSRGFGAYPAEEWWWGGALAESEGILYVKILSGKGLFITRRLWPSLDAVVRKVIRELENGRFDKYGLPNEAKRVFIYIREHGPVRTDLLRRALDMRSPAEGRAFHKAKNQLEGLGVLVGKAAKLEKHLHVGVLHLWTQLFPEPLPNASYERFEHALADFLYSAIYAAVVVSAKAAPRWFSWNINNQEMAINLLIERGRVNRFRFRDDNMLVAKRWL